MTTQGWFNHYDDPDEFWDEEPLVPKGKSVPVARAVDEPRAEKAQAQGLTTNEGSSFVTMEIDGGFMPIRIDFRPAWHRYVAPHEVGDELMRAYRKAVSSQFERSLLRESRHSLQKSSVTYVPNHRSMLMILLETVTWDEFSTVSSQMNCESRYEVHGRVLDDGGYTIQVTADRRYLRSIVVRSDWASSVDPDRISDEILWCVDTIRSKRPNYVPRGDYSRYSDEDLEYFLDRHRSQLLHEWVASV